MPETSAKEIIAWLMAKYPNQFTVAQTRTLQRRICEWRHTQQSLEDSLRTLMLNEKSGLLINSALASSIADNLNCNTDFGEIIKTLT